MLFGVQTKQSDGRKKTFDDSVDQSAQRFDDHEGIGHVDLDDNDILHPLLPQRKRMVACKGDCNRMGEHEGIPNESPPAQLDPS